MNTSIKLADVKANARGRLQGNYMQVIFVTITYFMFVLFIETFLELFNHDTSILSFTIGIVASFIFNAVNIKFKISLYGFYLELASGKKPDSGKIFRSFIREGGCKSGLAISVAVFQQICMLPSNILVFMPDSGSVTYLITLFAALITGFACYILIDIRIMPAYFLVNDIPNISSAKALVTALWLTKKQVIRILLLRLSFIPLSIVSALSCGIGFLFVYPYILTSDACMYQSLCNMREAAE